MTASQTTSSQKLYVTAPDGTVLTRTSKHAYRYVGLAKSNGRETWAQVFWTATLDYSQACKKLSEWAKAINAQNNPENHIDDIEIGIAQYVDGTPVAKDADWHMDTKQGGWVLNSEHADTLVDTLTGTYANRADMAAAAHNPNTDPAEVARIREYLASLI